jgi:hypothetical protein
MTLCERTARANKDDRQSRSELQDSNPFPIE